MATTARKPVDPEVLRKFHFTREMIEGPVYRKYEKAIRKFWSVEDLDFDAGREGLGSDRRGTERGLLGVTVRFLAGEQNVTDELVPMLTASHALKRFDWIVYLSTFLMEEANTPSSSCAGTIESSVCWSRKRWHSTSSFGARRSIPPGASKCATCSTKRCRTTADD